MKNVALQEVINIEMHCLDLINKKDFAKGLELLTDTSKSWKLDKYDPHYMF